MVELTTQLLIPSNILWLPLCRIYKFGLNTLPSKLLRSPILVGYQMAKIFEVKDFGYLHYFLGIEVVYGAEGIYLSQRKYVLDLLNETSMLGCKLAAVAKSSYLGRLR